MKAYNQQENTIFSYQDKGDMVQHFYSVVYPYMEPVKRVTVSQTHMYEHDKTPVLTINEFEVFGGKHALSSSFFFAIIDSRWSTGHQQFVSTSFCLWLSSLGFSSFSLSALYPYPASA